VLDFGCRLCRFASGSSLLVDPLSTDVLGAPTLPALQCACRAGPRTALVAHPLLRALGVLLGMVLSAFLYIARTACSLAFAFSTCLPVLVASGPHLLWCLPTLLAWSIFVCICIASGVFGFFCFCACIDVFTGKLDLLERSSGFVRVRRCPEAGRLFTNGAICISRARRARGARVRDARGFANAYASVVRLPGGSIVRRHVIHTGLPVHPGTHMQACPSTPPPCCPAFHGLRGGAGGSAHTRRKRRARQAAAAATTSAPPVPIQSLLQGLRAFLDAHCGSAFPPANRQQRPSRAGRRRAPRPKDSPSQPAANPRQQQAQGNDNPTSATLASRLRSLVDQAPSSHEALLAALVALVADCDTASTGPTNAPQRQPAAVPQQPAKQPDKQTAKKSATASRPVVDKSLWPAGAFVSQRDLLSALEIGTLPDSTAACASLVTSAAAEEARELAVVHKLTDRPWALFITDAPPPAFCVNQSAGITRQSVEISSVCSPAPCSFRYRICMVER
jgi:hypothetical protein